MRINLSFCSSMSSLNPKKLHEEHSAHGNFCPMGWITEKIMKLKCFGREKRRKKKTKQKKQLIVKELSLEEWFSHENHGFKPLSARDYHSESVVRERDCFYDSGEFSFSLEQLLNSSDSASVAKSAYSSDSVNYTFSLEKLLKDEDVDATEKGFFALTGQTCKEEKEFDSLTRSRSCKQKKKVSFKLPEVSDIIIIYSPELKNLKGQRQRTKHV